MEGLQVTFYFIWIFLVERSYCCINTITTHTVTGREGNICIKLDKLMQRKSLSSYKQKVFSCKHRDRPFAFSGQKILTFPNEAEILIQFHQKQAWVDVHFQFWEQMGRDEQLVALILLLDGKDPLARWRSKYSASQMSSEWKFGVNMTWEHYSTLIWCFSAAVFFPHSNV